MVNFVIKIKFCILKSRSFDYTRTHSSLLIQFLFRRVKRKSSQLMKLKVFKSLYIQLIFQVSKKSTNDQIRNEGNNVRRSFVHFGQEKHQHGIFLVLSIQINLMAMKT